MIINLGFGKANNIGIRKALDERADFVFLVNQDVYVATDALELLLRQYRASCGQGVLSPVHLAPDGSLDYSFADHVKRYVSPVHHDLIDDRGDCMIETDFVNAACWLIPAEVLRKVGVFNPVFPHYGEDNDFVNRLHYHGFKAYINPASIITHDRHQGERKKSIKELKKREYISFIKHYLNINLAEQEAMQVVMTKLRKESLYYFLTGSISKLRGLIAGYGQYENQKPELRKYREYSQQEGAYI